MFDLKLDHNSALHAKIREKSLLIESRIKFPDPMLMILERGKITFSPLWFLILKLYYNSGLHAKSERNLYSLVIKSEGFIGLYVEKYAGKGEELYKERGKCNIESRIEFTVSS